MSKRFIFIAFPAGNKHIPKEVQLHVVFNEVNKTIARSFSGDTSVALEWRDNTAPLTSIATSSYSYKRFIKENHKLYN